MQDNSFPWPSALAASFTILAMISLVQTFRPSNDSRLFERDARTPTLANALVDSPKVNDVLVIATETPGDLSLARIPHAIDTNSALETPLTNLGLMPKSKPIKQMTEKSKILGNLVTQSPAALPAVPEPMTFSKENDFEIINENPTSDFVMFKREEPKHDIRHRQVTLLESSELKRVIPSEILMDSVMTNKKRHNNRAEIREESNEENREKFELKSLANIPASVKTTTTPQLLARQYLENLDSIDNLHFQDATGYWANTYIPGDPSMRLIKNRLKQWDRSKLSSLLNTNTRLEDTLQQNEQPFDAPKNSALAVYLHADKNYLVGPSRLRLQIGIQATKRFSGNRPIMNIGVVLDRNLYADGNNNDTVKKISSLLKALAQSVQPGDRFSLTVSGPGGGTWIEPGEFRHGSVQIALNRLFIQNNASSDGALNLRDAYVRAANLVHKHDNPTATLGSSMLLLISDLPWSQNIDDLAAKTHLNAINGITTSVLSLNDSYTQENVEKIVLKGQGNHRLLNHAMEAEALIQRELLSSSRAIARAVRLRIRLAPGVKLIEVVNSYRLDNASAQQVREAEQSLDRRLSKNLGIIADRGKDEEGIQIIIPNFFAADSHSILLDVVAEKAGSVADVTIRYKDLLYLKNAVGRANLSLSSDYKVANRLSNNVVKNHLAVKLKQTMQRASILLASNDVKSALTVLTHMRDLLKGMRSEITGWNNDQEIVNDEKALNDYILTLQSPSIDTDLHYITESIEYAGIKKLLHITH